MRKNVFLFTAQMGLALVLTGCVSSAKYKKLQADSRTQNDLSAAKIASLEQEVSQLQQANMSLNQEKQDLQKKNEETTNQYQSVVGQLQQEVNDGQLKITQYKDMLTVDVAEKIFFDSGRANLKQGGKKVLQKVGSVLAQFQDKIIRVVGHTDNVPVAKSFQTVFPSNWELSVLRATNVVRFLQDTCKIPPERLIASGRGEYAPIALNDTPEGRQQNRRIEITLIDKSVVDAMGVRSIAPVPTVVPTPVIEPPQ